MSTPEMDASMGRPSNFHTGSTGVPKAALPAEKSTDPSLTDPKHVKSLVDGLKGLLGIAGKEPVPNGGLDALNKGLKDAE